MTLLRWLTHDDEVRYPALLLWIWLYFLIRAVFYASVIPVWEGYDGWSHFAYIEHVAAHSELPVAADTRVSREIERSLQLIPLPWTAKDSTSKHILHDEYWNAPDEKRRLLQEALHSIPPGWRVQPDINGRLLYEAQQPPLYYWLMSIPLRAARNAPLLERVYLIRYLSIAVASLLIPIGFLAARRVLCRDDLALAVAALLAAMPELMIDICRVGNESLAVVLYSTLVLVLVRYFDPGGGIREALAVGFVAASGLLTKAYFLTALPAIALILAVKFWRAGLGYHVLVTFVANGLSATCGWYAYALVVSECILIAAGWVSLGPTKSGKHIMRGVITAFVLLDLYGMHFLMIPYYSGIIEHTPAGALQALQVGQLWGTGLGSIATRIAANKPALLTPAVLIALWLAYLICTVRLPFSHPRPD